MRFSTVFRAAALLATALAQQVPLAFTTLPPAEVTVGQSYNLSWSGGTDAPVTITLKQGQAENLATIAIITGDASGNSYTWTVSSALTSGTDYALQISQGVDDTNYSGQFAITGGASPSTITSVSGSSTLVILTTVSNTSHVSTTSTIFVNSTTTAAPVGAGTGASSAGTGTALPRNTTFSSQSLTGAQTSSSSGSGAAATTTSSGASGSGSTATGGSSSGTSATSSGATSASQGSASLQTLGAQVLFGAGAVAAAMFAL